MRPSFIGFRHMGDRYKNIKNVRHIATESKRISPNVQICFVWLYLHADIYVWNMCAWIPANGSWWLHQMETFFVLLALCEGNSLVIVDFPSQRPVPWCFDVFVWSWPEKNGWVNNRYAGDFRLQCTHYDVTVMVTIFWIFEKKALLCLHVPTEPIGATSSTGQSVWKVSHSFWQVFRVISDSA